VAEVLVVDDSKVMRDMIAACLRPDDRLIVTQAASGLEAIERLSLKSFDVLVLDLNMPDIGGLEVVEFVRGQDKLAALPILIVTTRAEDDSRKNILAAGATKYMTKPFAPETILAEVQSLLQPTQPNQPTQPSLAQPTQPTQPSGPDRQG
jgi:two-component system, chemotaxis family, chemotaxis protein CheY